MGKKIVAAVVVLVALLLLIGGIYVAYNQVHDAKNDDPDSVACSGTDATLLVIDKTDPFAASEADRVAEIVRDFGRRLVVGEFFAILLLRNEGGSTTRVSSELLFSVCRPARGEDADILYDDPKKVQREYEESFKEPLEALVGEMVKSEEGQFSPIIEEIEKIILRSPEYQSAENKRIVVISDFLQNSSSYSLYKTEVLERQGLLEIVGDDVKKYLSGAVVELILVERPDRWEQQRDMMPTWRKFFEELGARPSSRLL